MTSRTLLAKGGSSVRWFSLIETSVAKVFFCSIKGRRLLSVGKFEDMGFIWVWLVFSRDREKLVRVGMPY